MGSVLTTSCAWVVARMPYQVRVRRTVPMQTCATGVTSYGVCVCVCMKLYRGPGRVGTPSDPSPRSKPAPASSTCGSTTTACATASRVSKPARDWWVGGSVGPLGWSLGLSVSCLVGWLVGWLVGCLVSWLVGWLVGRLVSWSVGRMVGRLGER